MIYFQLFTQQDSVVTAVSNSAFDNIYHIET
jgi:hypothetical protein